MHHPYLTIFLGHMGYIRRQCLSLSSLNTCLFCTSNRLYLLLLQVLSSTCPPSSFYNLADVSGCCTVPYRIQCITLPSCHHFYILSDMLCSLIHQGYFDMCQSNMEDKRLNQLLILNSTIYNMKHNQRKIICVYVR